MGLSKSQVRKKVDNSLCGHHDNYWYINSEGSKNIVDNGREDRGPGEAQIRENNGKEEEVKICISALTKLLSKRHFSYKKPWLFIFSKMPSTEEIFNKR